MFTSVNPINQSDKSTGSLLAVLCVVLLVIYRFLVISDNSAALTYQPILMETTWTVYIFFGIFAFVLPVYLWVRVFRKFGFFRTLLALLYLPFAICCWIYGVEWFISTFVDMDISPFDRAYANASSLAPLYVLNSFLPVFCFFLLSSIFWFIRKSNFLGRFIGKTYSTLVCFACIEAILLLIDLTSGQSGGNVMKASWVILAFAPVIFIIGFFFSTVYKKPQNIIDLEIDQKEWNTLYAKLLKEFGDNEEDAKAATESHLGPYPTEETPKVKVKETEAEVTAEATTDEKADDESESEKNGKLPLHLQIYTSILKKLYDTLEKNKPKVK